MKKKIGNYLKLFLYGNNLSCVAKGIIKSQSVNQINILRKVKYFRQHCRLSLKIHFMVLG